MATEEKKVSKLDSILNKIDAFFDGLMSAKKDEPEEDDDMSAAKTEDEPEAEAKPATKKAKKATDEEDSQDPDDDDTDPEKDDDDDTYAKDAEVKRLNSIIAKQNALLKAAQEALSERDEQVRDTIKSTFKPVGSQRTTKVAAKNELPSWATPQTELGKKAAKMAAMNKNKK